MAVCACVMVAMVYVLRAYALSNTVCLVVMDVAVVLWCSTSADALSRAALVQHGLFLLLWLQ